MAEAAESSPPCVDSLDGGTNTPEESLIEKGLKELSSEDALSYKLWRHNESTLRILAIGKTGAGKSKLLNGLFGVSLGSVDDKCRFKEGHSLQPGTTSVCTQEFIRGGIRLIVHDTPGLEDGTGNEAKYLEDIKLKKKEGVDLVLYCISMKETRADLSCELDHSVIDKISRELGADTWKNTIFVLTRANSYVNLLEDARRPIEDEFCKRIDEWRLKIREALIRNGVDDSVASRIRVEPAGHHKKPSLPGGRRYWLSNLWKHVFIAVSDRGKLAFLKCAEDRFKDSAQVTDADFRADIQNQPIIIDQSLLPSGDSEDDSSSIFHRLWQKIKQFISGRHRKKDKVDLRKDTKANYNTWL